MSNGNNVIKVFPRITSMTSLDSLSFCGEPPLPIFRPPLTYKVNVSVTFTWDIELGHRLRNAWEAVGYEADIGGPAFGFEPNNKDWQSAYLKPNILITSTGCNNKCPWCLVPGREGTIREIEPVINRTINQGEDVHIQDNNLLQCSDRHIYKVLHTLKRFKNIQCSGGLETGRITNEIADELRGLNIRQLFLACDTKDSLKKLKKAIYNLKGFSRDKIRCFVLIGYGNETLEQAEQRLKEVWEAGAMPFSQLYQPADKYIDYDQDWRDLNRVWSRPAIMKAINKVIV